jgi:uncharacterized protein (TIGR02996 family)
VDEDGHVAVFDTGEPGPMPRSAFGEQGAKWSMPRRLAEVPYDIEGFELISDGAIVDERGRPLEEPLSETYPLLLWLSDETALAALSQEAIRLTGSGGEILAHGDVSPSELAEITAAGMLRRAWIHDHDAFDLTRFGFYSYTFAHPYVRSDKRPASPPTLGQLPGELARDIGRLTLEGVSFERDAAIEPRLLVDCEAWRDDDRGGGPGWLSHKKWLAVDGAGQVAVLETGARAGPVPRDIGFSVDLPRRLAAALTSQPTFAYQLSDRLVDADGSLRRWSSDPGAGETIAVKTLPPWVHDALLWLRSAGAVPDVPSLRRIDCIDGSGDEVVVWGTLPRAALVSLREANAIRRGWIDHAIEHWRLGLFDYRAPETDEAPYRRQHVPARPLCCGDLPQHLCDHVARYSFPQVTFATTEQLEPRRYRECVYGRDAKHAGPPWPPRQKPPPVEPADESERAEPPGTPTRQAGAINPALEAALIRDPDDSRPYLVYSDWLRQQGDPRGELIAVQHALTKAKATERERLDQRQAELLAAHRRHLLGALVDTGYVSYLKLEWRWGFVGTAELLLTARNERTGQYSALPADERRRLLETLFALPVAKVLLGFRCVAQSTGFIVDDLLQIHPPETVRQLALGEIHGFGQRSAPSVGAVQELYPRLPRLEDLALGALDLSPDYVPDSQKLRRLSLAGGVNDRIVDAVRRLGRLEALSLRLNTTMEYEPPVGFPPSIASLASLLDGTLPLLAELCLTGAPSGGDELCALLLASEQLPRLGSLDLRSNGLTDPSADALCARRGRLRRLRRLDLRANRFSPTGRERLREALGDRLEIERR